MMLAFAEKERCGSWCCIHEKKDVVNALVVSADAAVMRRSKKRWIVAMPVVYAERKRWMLVENNGWMLYVEPNMLLL